MSRKKSKRIGRPPKDTNAVTCMMPYDMEDFIREIGLGSPSMGARILWNNIKDDKVLMKKIRGK